MAGRRIGLGLLARSGALLPPMEGGVEDLLLPLYQGLGLILARALAEAYARPALRRWLKVRSHGAARGADRRAKDVLEQLFCVLTIAPLSVWGWWVLLNHNGDCTPLAPRGCLIGWPSLPVTPQFRWWWLSMGGMYVGEMASAALGVGAALSKEMAVHHVITLALMLFGYFGGFHRYGQMATTVLDTSNAFLHLAKLVHASGLPGADAAKNALFKLFAAVFLVVRVVLPPFSMIVPGLVYGWQVLPLATFCVTNGLMLAIYSLQLMWFHKILRIAGGGADRRVHSYTPTPSGTPVALSPRASKQE